MTTIEKNNKLRDEFKTKLENEGKTFAERLSKGDPLYGAELEDITNECSEKIKDICGRFAAKTGKNAPEIILKFGAPGNYGPTWYNVLEKMILFIPLCCCIDTAAIRLGLRNWVMMSMISVVLGLSIVYAVFIARNIIRRKEMRKWLIKQYEEDIVPELLDWFDSNVSEDLKDKNNGEISANYFQNCVVPRGDEHVLKKYGTCCRVYVKNTVPWKEFLSGIQELCEKQSDSYEIRFDRIVQNGDPEADDGTSGCGCPADLAGTMGKPE